MPLELRRDGRAMSQTLVPRRPEVEILELTDEYIVFVLTKCDTSMANALRRVMIAEVPTMAIDKVEVRTASRTLAANAAREHACTNDPGDSHASAPAPPTRSSTPRACPRTLRASTRRRSRATRARS